jgi:hypothetical protein
MKKFIGITIASALLLAISSFGSTSTKGEKEDGDVTSSQVWEYMHENVFDKLNTLVNYDKKKSFSRCPSGFGLRMDNENSNNDFVYGSITFAQGCDRDHYCFYKVDWNKKETFLKKSEKEEFVALDTFVKNNKGKTVKI